MPPIAKSKLPKYGKRVFKNPAEYECFKHLKDILSEDFLVEYETETLDYVTKHIYRPDFPVIRSKDGTKRFIEYKGGGRAFDHAVRKKMVAVKAQYPQYDFCIVFHSDGKFGPKRKDGSCMTQSEWATKNGFKFCIGKENIPLEWFR